MRCTVIFKKQIMAIKCVENVLSDRCVFNILFCVLRGPTCLGMSLFYFQILYMFVFVLLCETLYACRDPGGSARTQLSVQRVNFVRRLITLEPFLKSGPLIKPNVSLMQSYFAPYLHLIYPPLPPTRFLIPRPCPPFLTSPPPLVFCLPMVLCSTGSITLAPCSSPAPLPLGIQTLFAQICLASTGSNPCP